MNDFDASEMKAGVAFFMQFNYRIYTGEIFDTFLVEK